MSTVDPMKKVEMSTVDKGWSRTISTILEAVTSELDYNELCAALLCLFFSSGLNKTQFENILEVFKFINGKNHYPKILMNALKCY